MVTRTRLILVLLTAVVFIGQAQNDWPKIIETDNFKVTVYQPQLDSLVGDALYGMAAVAYKDGEAQPVFGALWFAAALAVDRSTRRASVDAVDIHEIRFPENSGMSIDTADASRFFSEEVPKWKLEFSIDEIVSALEARNVDQGEGFKDEAPEIIYATTPSVLILLDGDPQWQSVSNNVDRAVNTPSLLFEYDDQYYVYGNGNWYTSPTMSDWSHIEKPPKALNKAFKELISDEARKQMEKDESDIIVDIELRTKPAELIQTTGEADLLPITGTNLLYVTNTESDILFDINRQKYYALISGRWLTAPALDGAWTLLPPTDLPADFARIPEGNDKDAVLSNVPGTQANKEALMDANVPQTAAVDRETATTQVKYDGTPKFKKLEGSSIAYCENSDKQVLKQGGIYYCVDDGIWYRAERPEGPWTVSTTRPKGVDDIPASAPVYNVRYVYIYDYTPRYVYCGYLPAYTGCYVYRGVPVYGTGWYYRPWYGRYYYPRPYTWGFHMSYNPWYGYSMGMHYTVGGPFFNFSIHYGSSGYRSPYRGYYGGYFGCYNWRPPYRPPYRGWYGGRPPRPVPRSGSVNMPRNTVSRINSRNNYGNMYARNSWGGNSNLGNRPTTRDAKNVTARPGVAKTGTRPTVPKTQPRPGSVRPSPARPAPGNATRPSTRPSTGGISPSIPNDRVRPAQPSVQPPKREPYPNTSNKKVPARPSRPTQDIYTDKRGDTYKKSKDQWQSTRPKTQPSAPAGRDLNRDAYSRQRSQQRSNHYQSRPSARPSSRPSPRGGRGRG